MGIDLVDVNFQQFHAGQSVPKTGGLIVEKPVALFVNGDLWITFMCTPNKLKALALGFLFNEGIIEDLGQIAEFRICDHGDTIDIWLKHKVDKPREWKRTSGCTGGYTALDLETVKPDFDQRATLAAEQVQQLVEKLFESQDLYKKTGGVHTSILTDGDQLIISAEDVGRHNSMDKVAGLYLMGDERFSKKVLLSTGRISSDMLQKAASIGAAIVISRTSPTSMSVELAKKWGVTLIGYARRDRFNVYAHPSRIVGSTNSEVYRAEKNVPPSNGRS
ncbi:MAG: formate dehydrogenase accessory sulfurtransferase FdhD [Anaerolineales bacterium]